MLVYYSWAWLQQLGWVHHSALLMSVMSSFCVCLYVYMLGFKWSRWSNDVPYYHSHPRRPREVQGLTSHCSDRQWLWQHRHQSCGRAWYVLTTLLSESLLNKMFFFLKLEYINCNGLQIMFTAQNHLVGQSQGWLWFGSQVIYLFIHFVLCLSICWRYPKQFTKFKINAI